MQRFSMSIGYFSFRFREQLAQAPAVDLEIVGRASGQEPGVISDQGPGDASGLFRRRWAHGQSGSLPAMQAFVGEFKPKRQLLGSGQGITSRNSCPSRQNIGCIDTAQLSNLQQQDRRAD